MSDRREPYIIVSRRPAWIQLHMKLPLLPRQFIILRLLFPGEGVPLQQRKGGGGGGTNRSEQNRQHSIEFMFSTPRNENIKHLNIDVFVNGRRPRAADIPLESGWRQTQTLLSLFCSLISQETHQRQPRYPK